MGIIAITPYSALSIVLSYFMRSWMTGLTSSISATVISRGYRD